MACLVLTIFCYFNLRKGEIMLLAKNEYVTIEVPAFIERAMVVAKQAGLSLLIVASDPIFDKLQAHNIDKLLVFVIKPCPCGNFDTTATCTCQAQQVESYQHKFLSGGDMRVDGTLTLSRFKFTGLDAMCLAFLKQAYAEKVIDADWLVKCLDIARGIMELDGKTVIEPEHVAEALSYRKNR